MHPASPPGVPMAAVGLCLCMLPAVVWGCGMVTHQVIAHRAAEYFASASLHPDVIGLIPKYSSLCPLQGGAARFQKHSGCARPPGRARRT
eukprot:NODE_19219_length_275_cov_1.915929_g18051_i0.p1 GENE.NODE_19219_length_275_cov_1.915929_g18051_i0~~NODE_19219_length_275_cov_1.915929_g18051_i0.p1  ORF type:complete len:90 (-),score=5.30 NODE_19219_length_275_cov_1.915929_g18051_i0:4-273(-)